MEDCLQLVHCHPGSQLQDIRRVKDAVNELAHVYAELKLMGAGLRYIDVGGGLGVDYDGSRTNYASSMNYTLAEYASDVVYRIANVCNARGIEHPVIVERVGPRHRGAPQPAGVQRARQLGARPLQRERAGCARHCRRRRTCRSRCATCATPTARSPSGGSWSATTTRSRRASRRCRCSTSATSASSTAAWSSACTGPPARRSATAAAGSRRVPEELEGLESILSDIYFCNFSVFQSLPDSWAIDQLFPIMPIHRLDERPTRNAVLADITCDSDGKIDHFVEPARDQAHARAARAARPASRTTSRRFMVGAYQETLGDLHNLFGDTHVVHIKLHERGRLVDRGDGQGRHGGRGAALHALRRRAAAAAARARLRARRARGPAVARREPGAAALLRRRAERLHVPRAGLTSQHRGWFGRTRWHCCLRRAGCRQRGRRQKRSRRWTSRRRSRFSARCSWRNWATRRSSPRCCSPPTGTTPRSPCSSRPRRHSWHRPRSRSWRAARCRIT
ncbi:MAG: hypothetical protein MZV70_42990 [Desulfobacterales bacterium]|nr:hypothetical protein [Desulfobacterales bacterium]